MTTQIEKLEISIFLKFAKNWPVIDVRSPSEYNSGHIPGAFNIPLFNDSEREQVGIKYKKEGRGNAILKGLELSGPSLALKLDKALKIAGCGKLLVYCWRGGMRSEAMSWLFSLGNIETKILDGGYKSYRRYILGKLDLQRRLVILGGLTGSGKTEILGRMKNLGHQIIDLEEIACHKGSAFGSLGKPAQPTSEQFANLLFEALEKTDGDKPVWIEDESRSIGTVFMPEKFYLKMLASPVVAIIMDTKTRLPRLLKEYSEYPVEALTDSINKITKRLGREKAIESIDAVESGNFARAIEITLNYYDKAYLFGLKIRQGPSFRQVDTDTDNVGLNTEKVLDAAAPFLD